MATCCSTYRWLRTDSPSMCHPPRTARTAARHSRSGSSPCRDRASQHWMRASFREHGPEASGLGVDMAFGRSSHPTRLTGTALTVIPSVADCDGERTRKTVKVSHITARRHRHTERDQIQYGGTAGCRLNSHGHARCAFLPSTQQQRSPQFPSPISSRYASNTPSPSTQELNSRPQR